MLTTVKRLMPVSAKRAVRTARLRYLLWRAVSHIAELPLGAVPSRALLQEAFLGWGNEGFAADLKYLEAISTQAAITLGPVLECGTGLTTILLGLLAGRRGVEIWSLENSPEWLARIQQVLSRNRIPGVRACYACLHDYGEYEWYEPPLEQMPNDFRLVVCDGPPGSTRGGRYGLFPVMSERLSPGAVVLMDDALRPNERAIVEEWKQHWPLAISLQESDHGAYASIKLLEADPRGSRYGF